MVTIPGFLLRRLYVRGSLRNTESGAQFQLLNKLGSGYAQELLPLSVDGEDISLDRCTFAVDGTLFPFDAVSNDTPFTLDLNKATTINMSGVVLSDEPHTIGMGFRVPGLGMLQFDFQDVPANE